MSDKKNKMLTEEELEKMGLFDSEEIPSSQKEETSFTSTARPIELNEFEKEMETQREKAELEMLYDIPIEIIVKLADTIMSIQEILDLQVGDVIELEKMIAEPVEVYAGDVLIAKGEIFIVEDKFGVELTEIVEPAERIEIAKNILKK